MDTEREIILDGHFENLDPGDYIEEAFARIDRNFERLFSGIIEVSSSIDLTDAQYRTFSYNGITFRIGVNTDHYFELQQAFTDLGFDGIESMDQGATGDWGVVWKYNLLLP
jgi:hypothetical protein